MTREYKPEDMRIVINGTRIEPFSSDCEATPQIHVITPPPHDVNHKCASCDKLRSVIETHPNDEVRWN